MESMGTRTTKLGSDAAAVMEPMAEETGRILDSYRQWGYLEADLDPLGFWKPSPHPDLPTTGAAVGPARAAYSGTIGVEFMHIPDAERRRWIQQHMETEPAEVVDREHVLELLIRADLFEQVLQNRYL